MRLRIPDLLILLACTAGLWGCTQSDDAPSTAEKAAAEATAPPAATADQTAASSSVAADDPQEAAEMDWDALIPEQWRPDVLMAEYDADNLSDDDPRAQELYEKLQTLWQESPVVPTLEGQRIRLPGFVVPLEMDAESIDEFLLVPYYGACIHAPPPPANQTVHVVTAPGQGFDGAMFDTVWVTGTMRVESHTSELAEAGYRLEQASVAPYQESPVGDDPS